MKSFIRSPDISQSTLKVNYIEEEKTNESVNKPNKRLSNKMMQNRSKMINKLALVLLSIVLLELVLIGNQVQPVKAIKKKIYLKKLKKLLPLLALVKPKKKIILVPIPIPMFKNSGHRLNHGYQHHQHHQHPYGPPPMPMSFMMMGPSNNEPGALSVSMNGDPHISMLPMTEINNLDPVAPMMAYMGDSRPPPPRPSVTPSVQQAPANTSSPTSATSSSSSSSPTSDSASLANSMMVPSVTMTVQSEPGGGSNIELSTNLGPQQANASGALMQFQTKDARWRPQQQNLQQSANEQFDEQPADQAGGEHYYSSPWRESRVPLTSPAKVFRGERLRQKPQAGSRQQPHSMAAAASAPPPSRLAQPQQQQQQPTRAHVMIVKSQWRPTSAAFQVAQRQQEQQQQSGQEQLEFEELVPIGPPQMMPVYQTANGQLHLTPPPPPVSGSGAETSPSPRPQPSNGSPQEPAGRSKSEDLNSEVQTINPTDGNVEQPSSSQAPDARPQSRTLATIKYQPLRQTPAGSGGRMDSFSMMENYEMPMDSGMSYGSPASSSSGYGSSSSSSYSSSSPQQASGQEASNY